MTLHSLPPGSLTGDALNPADVAVSFFRTEAFGESLSRARFTVDEEVRLLVDLMRHADPKIALAAQSSFRRTLGAVAAADGMIGKQTLTVRDRSGRSVSVSRSILPQEVPNGPTAREFAATYLPPSESPALPPSVPPVSPPQPQG